MNKFIDSCSYYRDPALVWNPVAGAVIAVGGNPGGQDCLQLNDATSFVNKSFIETDSVGIVGFKMFFNPVKFAGGVRQKNTVVAFLDEGGGIQVAISFDSVTSVTAWRGGVGNVILKTTNYAPTATVVGRWVNIQVRVLADPDAGSVEVRIGNAVILTVSGVNTTRAGSTKIGGFTLGSAYVSTGPGDLVAYTLPGGLRFADIYFNDSTGGVDNTYWGPVLVRADVPSNPGALDEFSVSGATKVAAVSDIPSDGDAGYIFAILAERQLYSFPAMPNVGFPVVKKLEVITMGRSSGAVNESDSVAAFQHLVSGATLQHGPTQSAGVSYGLVRTGFRVNPVTGLPWTTTDVNGSSLGLKRVTS